MLYPIPAIFSAAICLLLLGGCAELREGYDEVKDFSYDKAAGMVGTVCRRSLPLRKEALTEINSRTEQGWWTATDCDRDGQPDFEIDPATGLPIDP